MKLPYLFDLIAVGVFAVSGCLAAGRKVLDLVGVFVVAVVTAVGGGTLRDLLLDRHPIFWVHDGNFLYVIAAAVLATMAYVRFRGPPEKVLLVADSIGLSVYAIVGAQLTEARGHPAIVAVALGTLTATAGGVLRDMLCNDIPILFREGYLYAAAAAAGATCYVLTEEASAATPRHTWGSSWSPSCGSGRSSGSGTCRGSNCGTVNRSRSPSPVPHRPAVSAPS